MQGSDKLLGIIEFSFLFISSEVQFKFSCNQTFVFNLKGNAANLDVGKFNFRCLLYLTGFMNNNIMVFGGYEKIYCKCTVSVVVQTCRSHENLKCFVFLLILLF